jgi:hypothetical protein
LGYVPPAAPSFPSVQFHHGEFDFSFLIYFPILLHGQEFIYEPWLLWLVTDTCPAEAPPMPELCQEVDTGSI